MSALRDFRKERKLSQREIAEIMHVSLSMYEKVERGQMPHSRAFMEKLKRAYPEANIEYLFFSNYQHVTHCDSA